jgi:hypothetical protein
MKRYWLILNGQVDSVDLTANFQWSKQSIAVGFALFKESVYLGSTRKYMYSYKKVSVQEATSLIEKVVSEITGMNKHIAVGVTGRECELLFSG